MFVVLEIWPITAFIGHALEPSLRRHQLAGGAVNLSCPVERLRVVRRTDCGHHKVLNIHAAPGMCPAAENLDLR